MSLGMKIGLGLIGLGIVNLLLGGHFLQSLPLLAVGGIIILVKLFVSGKLDNTIVSVATKVDDYKTSSGSSTTSSGNSSSGSLLSRANSGDTDAMFELANDFISKASPSNEYIVDGLDWMEKAADRGHSEAQFELGSFYKGLEDYDKSFEWLNKSANNGNEKAKQALQELKKITGR